ncbi:MAG: IMPACT family protein [Propionibacteriaceae bacterium]
MTNSAATRYTVLRSDSDVTIELEIKRSIFLCTLRRAETETQARALIEQARSTHHDARHHCSAFIIGPDRMMMRSNDDGEPSGTAGTPMLEALAQYKTAHQIADLSDISSVVTRWFGGTLLGAGGLVRAYSEAVSTALAAASYVSRQRLRLIGFDVALTHAGRWETDLRHAGILVEPAIYGATSATLSVRLVDSPTAKAEFTTLISSITAGAISSDDLIDLGTSWQDITSN